MNIFLKSIWFQSLWFLAVLGRESTVVLLALLVAITYLRSLYQRELSTKFCAFIVGCGLAVDFLNTQLSILVFESNGLPLWLVFLWLIFAWYCWQLRDFIRKTSQRIILFAGGVGGTLSYLAGYKLGAVGWFYTTEITLTALFAEWILLSLITFQLLKMRRGML